MYLDQTYEEDSGPGDSQETDAEVAALTSQLRLRTVLPGGIMHAMPLPGKFTEQCICSRQEVVTRKR